MHLRVQLAVHLHQPPDRRQGRDAAGRQHKAVVADSGAVNEQHLVAVAVDLEYPCT
jgi:hypothetical protein